MSQQNMELTEVLDSLERKHGELQSCLDLFKKENCHYKRRYEVLEQRLVWMTKSLEQNAQVFHQLFHETKGALQMARISSSPPAKNGEIVEKEVVNKPIPWELQPRKRTNLERFNLQELDKDEEVEDDISNRLLSTSAEEPCVSSMKDAHVLLTPLPFTVVSKYQNEPSTSSSDNSTLFESSGMVFESTPKKPDHMKRLGLSPVNVLNPQSKNFINIRRKNNRNESNGNKSRETESVKKMNDNKTKANNSLKTKRKNEEETVGRPKRKARSQQLKVSLKKTIRKHL